MPAGKLIACRKLLALMQCHQIPQGQWSAECLLASMHLAGIEIERVLQCMPCRPCWKAQVRDGCQDVQPNAMGSGKASNCTSYGLSLSCKACSRPLWKITEVFAVPMPFCTSTILIFDSYQIRLIVALSHKYWLLWLCLCLRSWKLEHKSTPQNDFSSMC